MTAGTASQATDRSDFRTVVAGGAKIGAATALAVVLSAVVTPLGPAAVRPALQALVVLAAAGAASFLPAHWVGARSTEGIAGAATVGFVGTVVFTAIDIVVLRPLNHVVTIYAWTWDAVGGNSTWWYLPIWWMLGTYVAWMGGLLVAGRAARGETALARVAAPVLAVALALTVAARMGPLGIDLPVAVGGGFTIALTGFAVVAIARTA